MNAGCGHSMLGDINLDISPRNVPNFVQGDVQDLSQFSDKKFSVAICSHVLEHVDDPDKAISELHRVADNVVIIVPGHYDVGSWFWYEHKWAFVGDKKIKINGALNFAILLPFLFMGKQANYSVGKAIVGGGK